MKWDGGGCGSGWHPTSKGRG